MPTRNDPNRDRKNQGNTGRDGEDVRERESWREESDEESRRLGGIDEEEVRERDRERDREGGSAGGGRDEERNRPNPPRKDR